MKNMLFLRFKEPHMQQRDNLLSIVASVFKRKKQILWLCAIAAIGAILISLLLPNYYKSTSVFYAASTDLTLPDPVGPDLKERAIFGVESDLDKIMNCASSTELVDYLVEKFDLYTHYDINPDSKKGRFKVREALGGLMDLKKTKFEAIELSIEDKDPEFAAQMVNAAVDKVNAIAQNLTKSAQAKQIESKRASVIEKEKSIVVLGDTLSALSERYSIYNVTAQSESITESLTNVSGKLALVRAKLTSLKESGYSKRDSISYIKAQEQGFLEQWRYLESSVDNFNQGSSLVGSISRQLQIAQSQYAEDKERLKQLEAVYNFDAPMVLVLEKGEIPIVKSRPKRSLLVIGAVFITFIFTVIFAILMDLYNDINWKEIVDAK